MELPDHLSLKLRKDLESILLKFAFYYFHLQFEVQNISKRAALDNHRLKQRAARSIYLAVFWEMN